MRDREYGRLELFVCEMLTRARHQQAKMAERGMGRLAQTYQDEIDAYKRLLETIGTYRDRGTR